MLAEVNELQTLEMHWLGFEQWRLLKYNIDSASALSAMSGLERIRNLHAKRKVSKINPFERRRQECFRQAVGSREPEFVKMRTHGIRVHPRSVQSGLGESAS